jgi:transcription elongation factor GreA
MNDTSKMTPAAYDALRAEIEQLETEGRREKAEKIGVARQFGDLKENAEYHAAKDDAALLEAKISRLKEQLRSAEIVENTEGGAAGMGSTVTYVDEESGRESSHKLVSAREAKPAEGLLSIDSPVGKVLAGAHPGDTRSLETPKGTRTMRIVSVEHA